MSLTGWFGLAFTWLVITGIIAFILTFQWAKAGKARGDNMPLTTVKYENAKPDMGILNLFAIFWFGLFAAGCGVVGVFRLAHGTAGIFSWIDSVFQS
jgi:hypothetical protein